MGKRARRWLEALALDQPSALAWAMYDWANSAFMLTVVTTFFPAYFLVLSEGALSEDLAQQRFAETTRDSLIVIALIAPVLGALADVKPLKKRLLACFVLLGAASTAGMFTLLPGDWELALGLFALANIGAAGSIVFYDALLPHVAPRGKMDRLSTSGYAIGYIGSGLLLAVNLVCVSRPDWFGLPHGDGLSTEEATLPTRIAFLSVAIWWVIFTLPLLRRVPEPRSVLSTEEASRSTLGTALRRLLRTLKDLRGYRDASRMLVAFLLYNDGIATLIRMAVIYALAQGIDKGTVIQSVLVLQFIGVPCSILFGALGTRFGAKPMILVGVAVYSLISIVAFYMTAEWHFVVLALLVGTVQGGTQGLSRSLFASMVPQHRSGEFFALFGVGEKFAGIFGPLVFALVISATGTARNAILSVVVFFILGALLLSRVDVSAGRARAREEERLAA